MCLGSVRLVNNRFISITVIFLDVCRASLEKIIASFATSIFQSTFCGAKKIMIIFLIQITNPKNTLNDKHNFSKKKKLFKYNLSS